MKKMTLVFLLKDNDKVCLGYKKRGFGAGKWNGYGGKVEKGETVEAAACREVNEESGVSVAESDLEKIAIHLFHFINGDTLKVHVYFARQWQGDPVETEEMRPDWYQYENIPLDLMWVDDRYWLPQVLQGEKLKGDVTFDETGEKISKMNFERVTEF